MWLTFDSLYGVALGDVKGWKWGATFVLALFDIKNTFVDFVLWWAGFFCFWKFFAHVLKSQSLRVEMLILLSIIVIEVLAFFLLLLLNNAGE